MRITIGSGMSEIVLADYGGEGPENFSLKPEDQLQVIDLLRATHAEAVNRGNRRWRLEFSRTRDHGSVDAAEKFLLEHADSLPRTGDIYIWREGQVYTGMEAVAPYVLSGATIHAFDLVPHGTSTTYRYVITGGTLTPPAEEE